MMSCDDMWNGAQFAFGTQFIYCIKSVNSKEFAGVIFQDVQFFCHNFQLRFLIASLLSESVLCDFKSSQTI